MSKIQAASFLAVSVSLICVVPAFSAQVREDATVRSASAVLDEVMALQVKAIPLALLADAQAIAIVPNVIKGGFVVGVRHGKGVLLVRDDKGGWRPPLFISLTGGSVGFQVGVQATDVVLVFKTRNSVEGLLTGKFTIGADASAAAGPLGRNAAVATDGRLQAEIYSYSRSRGLFAGVALDGSALEVDANSGAMYYRSSGLSPQGDAMVEGARLPESASKLMLQVARYSSQKTVATASTPDRTVAPEAQQFATLNAPANLRLRLGQSSQQLLTLLDANWQRYLALPSQIYTGREHPPLNALQQALANYEAVASGPQYRALSTREEFRTTRQLLRQYVEILTPVQPRTLQLPPPPSPAR